MDYTYVVDLFHFVYYIKSIKEHLPMQEKTLELINTMAVYPYLLIL